MENRQFMVPGGIPVQPTVAPSTHQALSSRESGASPHPPVTKTSCRHRRLIDDVLNEAGKPTGKVRCIQCGDTFDDPYNTTA